MNYVTTITPTEVNYVFYVLFVLWSVFSLYYIFKVAKTRRPKSVIIEVYDSIPSVFTTLGVLGTFIGIFVGLSHFDTRSIDTSIPLLLDGLKTAFLTSIIGLILSLIFGKLSRIFMEKAERSHNPLNDTSELTTEALLLESLVNQIGDSNRLLETLSERIESLSERSEVTASTLLVVKPNDNNASGSSATKSSQGKNNSGNNASNPLNASVPEQTVNNAQLVVDKLSTNFAHAINSIDNPHETEKLKAAIVQGIDPDLAIDQISQVVVVDNAKEKLKAYQDMERRLDEVCQAQAKFFEDVAANLDNVLVKFKEDVNKTVSNVKQQVDAVTNMLDKSMQTQTEQVISSLQENTKRSISDLEQNLTNTVQQTTIQSQQDLEKRTQDIFEKVRVETNNLTQTMVQDSNNLETRTHAVIDTLSQVSGQLESAMLKAHEHAVEALKDLHDSNRAHSQEELNKFVSATSDNLQKFLHVTEEFSSYFNRVSDQITKQSDENNQHVDKLSQELSRQYQQVNYNIDQMRQNINSLEKNSGNNTNGFRR